jgi:hypothetical protein
VLGAAPRFFLQLSKESAVILHCDCSGCSSCGSYTNMHSRNPRTEKHTPTTRPVPCTPYLADWVLTGKPTPMRTLPTFCGLLTLAAVVAMASAARVADVECVPKCVTDLDCSLNGVCKGGSCLCDAAWTGPCCTALNLLPVPTAAPGYRHPNTSTWGGNIIVANGTYHMW